MTELLPSRHQVEAAVHVAELLTQPVSTLGQIRESFQIVPNGGRFASHDLEAGLSILLQANLVVSHGEQFIVARGIDTLRGLSVHDAVSFVVMQLLSESKPLWLRAGLLDDGEYAEEIVPHRVLSRLRVLFRDPVDRERLLLAAARKVDTERRTEIGALGEIGVIRAAREKYRHLGVPELSNSIRHVSLISDELGYDIVAPSATTGDQHRLEVKTCVSSSYLRIYISRAEADWGIQDPKWHLVVCALDEDGSARIVGSLQGCDFQDRLPTDANRDAHRWESASLRLRVSDLTPGLAMLN